MLLCNISYLIYPHTSKMKKFYNDLKACECRVYNFNIYHILFNISEDVALHITISKNTLNHS